MLVLLAASRCVMCVIITTNDKESVILLCVPYQLDRNWFRRKALTISRIAIRSTHPFAETGQCYPVVP